MHSLTELCSVTNLFFIELLILTDLYARLNMSGPPRYNTERCCTGQRPSLDSCLCIHMSAWIHIHGVLRYFMLMQFFFQCIIVLFIFQCIHKKTECAP